MPRWLGCSASAVAGTGLLRITAALWRRLAAQRTVSGHGRGLDARAACSPRKKCRKAGKGRWRTPDRVKRKSGRRRINLRWYGDGTEVKTAEGMLYLDSTLDMGSRRILGFALAARHVWASPGDLPLEPSTTSAP